MCFDPNDAPALEIAAQRSANKPALEDAGRFQGRVERGTGRIGRGATAGRRALSPAILVGPSFYPDPLRTLIPHEHRGP